MSHLVQLGLPLVFLAEIKEAIGCMVLGTILSTAVYGVSILQCYIYFRNSKQDSKYMRAFVALLFTLDTASMVLNVDGLYKYVVSDFGNPLLLAKVPVSLAYLNGITVLIGTLTQCFFAHRLWALSKGNALLVASILIVSLCSFGPGMVIFVHLCTSDQIAFVGTVELRVLAAFASGLSVLCDMLIVAGLCYYLHSKRTGFTRTDSIIDRLIVYAINRGVLTTMCHTAYLITTVALPKRFIDLPFGLLDGKLYCSTLLATLNAQKSLRSDGDHIVELGTQILGRINASSKGNGEHQGTVGWSESAGDGVSTKFAIGLAAGNATDTHTRSIARDA